MKRCLDDDENESIKNFQRQNNKNKEIKKTNENELEELCEILNNIIENDKTNVTINVNTKLKEICVNEELNGKENNRKYKYVEKSIESLISSINDDIMYKEVDNFLLNLNNENIFANKDKWTIQLLNEISYINLLEEEKQKEDELIKLLETNLTDLKL